MKKYLILALFLALPSITFANFDTNLKYGDRGEKVVELQEFLISEGYMTGSATGNFFSITRKAIKDFQLAHNLPNTGYFGVLSRGVVNGIIAINEDVPNSEDLFSGVTKPTVEVQNEELKTKLDQVVSELNQIKEQSKVVPQPIMQEEDLSGLVLEVTKDPRVLVDYPLGGWKIKVNVIDSKGKNLRAVPVKIEAVDNSSFYPIEGRTTDDYTGNYSEAKDWHLIYSYTPTSTGTKTLTFTSPTTNQTKTITIEVK